LAGNTLDLSSLISYVHIILLAGSTLL